MSADTSAPDPRAITVGFVTGAGGLGDMSFNDMAYGGLRKAQQELGFALNVLEADATGTAKTEAVAHLVRQCDIMVLLGAQHTGHARVFAEQFPEKKFIFYEEKVSGIPNLASILFRQHEGSFLAGALAGRVSKTRRVGFLGGTDIPPVAAFAQGFMEGVRHVAPDVVVEIHHVSGPGDFSGFDNPDAGFTMAAAMFEDGVDIIFAVAGLTGNGVIEAARRTENRYVIGVDSDQDDMARGKVLTSMVKRLDTATYAEVSKAVQGRFTMGVADFGLVSGGVSLTDMRHTRDIISAPVVEELESLRQAIIDGKIVVTDLRP
ncbi:BMP family lipoprotein [Desulfovibrio psychrotolerans]|uniref:BMP family ABC transporter substrate-binding protein n=1 Tax=Desulfovibrio psychrotolerans TaxID=415242 RepID=A0A7J0BXF1_9BACT|nr:BMP family ABC transporter substrate-binding protein [Desulfovibrio psychrotolerans]GFM37865.1 BMP family ABC transporter substrate-binding protein [Desulfovibrio psychrotolerans]